MNSSVNGFQQILAVIGSRTQDKDSHNRVKGLVNHLFKGLDQHSLVISGGAITGADYWAKALCNQNKIPYIEAVAFWNATGSWGAGYDKTAGHFRNRIIVRLCTRMVAFWDQRSPGTGGAIKYARMIGKPVEIIDISVIHPLDLLALPKSHPLPAQVAHLHPGHSWSPVPRG